MKTSRMIICALAGLALQSCAKEDNLRVDGMTMGAGDSIAINRSLQVIDPWPDGVEDTDLSVPSDRGVTKKDGDAGGTPASPTGTP